jgi:hypothetical protein
MNTRSMSSARWWGDLKDQDMFDYLHQIGMDPRFSPEFAVLLDLSDATDYTGLTLAALKEVA